MHHIKIAAYDAEARISAYLLPKPSTINSALAQLHEVEVKLKLE